MLASAFLIGLGAYLACGLGFAVAFSLTGVRRLDPTPRKEAGFRLLIIPGVTAFWPLLLRRWLAGVKQPPEECTVHRRLAAAGVAQEEAPVRSTDGRSQPRQAAPEPKP